jgi:hypothetical protein
MCAKFKISNKFKQNIGKTHSKQPKKPKNPNQFMDFKNHKEKIRKPKISKLLPNVCEFQKKLTP